LFEREFSERVGIPHAVALASGTAAIHLALRQLNIDPGDEVLASTLTFIGSVTPVLFEGGTPVFVDVDPDTWNIDPDLVAEELEACQKRGRLPKAVIPTDLYGQCADLDRILGVCAPYSIPVIVDAAEALGATYKRRHAGSGARAAIYSFNGNKIITTSGGGMLASEDQALIEQARFLSEQARDLAPHYEHSQIGYNYRMSNIVAAIGRGQLRVLDERVEQKRRIFDFYRSELGDVPGIEFMPEAPYGQCTRWLTVILITPEEFGADRETIRTTLEAENIESRPVWKPMHLQPVFNHRKPRDANAPRSRNNCQARAVGGAVSEDLFNRGLCLPSGTQMTEEDLTRVVRIIRDIHLQNTLKIHAQ
jgi:dTDP-4-amino-4,6-dideoxygalactose transaminase